jgi:hypothetical protein
MTPLQKKILTKNSMQTVFYGTKLILHGMTEDFLKYWVLDKLNPTWFASQYSFITQTKSQEKYDVTERVQHMIESCDSSNYSSQTTKYSFRYSFVFPFNSFKD